LFLEVVDTSDGLEVVDQTDDSLLLLFFCELVILQKTVHLSGDTEHKRPGVDLNFLVDEPGGCVQIEAELIVGWKHLLFEQLFNVSTLPMASLDNTSHFFKERGVLLVVLDCLSGVDKGDSQLLHL